MSVPPPLQLPTQAQPSLVPHQQLLKSHSQLGDSSGRGARHPMPGACGLVPLPVGKALLVVRRRLLKGQKCFCLYFCRNEVANEVVKNTQGQ